MNVQRDWRLPVALLLALGLVGVFAYYYWAHKPIGPAQAGAVGGTLASLGVALALTVLGGAVGRRWLGAWSAAEWAAAETAAAERAAVQAACGWGVLGLALLAVGLAGAFHPVTAWVGALLLFVWLRREARAWLAEAAAGLRGLAGDDGLSWLAAGVAAFALLLGLLRALAPPLMWDALVYHLTLPRLYAQAGGVRLPLADFSLFTGMPQLTEMLYTAAVLLRVDAAAGAIAAQTLGWCMGAVLVLGLGGTARALRLPAALPGAVLLAAFSVALSLAWAYAEWFIMLLAWAVLVALRQWRAVGETRWLVLAGALAGWACGCKYTGALVPLGGLAVVIAGAFSGAGGARARLRAGVVAGAVFSLTALAVFAPWLLKNWLFTGSPFYPLLWPAADMDSLRQWFYSRPDEAERSLLRGVLLFPRAVFLGVQGGNDYDVTLGPLFVLLPLALALAWHRLPPEQRAALRPMVFFAAGAYAGWVALAFLSPLGRQGRMFFAALPALALLGAAGLGAARCLDTPALRIGWVLRASVVVALGLAVVEQGLYFAAHSPLPYLAGAQSRQDYVTARLGWHAAALERVNALPAGARVVFLWEARSLDCAPTLTCVPDVVIDRWWHLRRTLGSAEAIVAEWQRSGVTHVLVYDTGQAFAQAEGGAFEPADWDELGRLRAALVEREALGGVYTLYEVP